MRGNRMEVEILVNSSPHRPLRGAFVWIGLHGLLSWSPPWSWPATDAGIGAQGRPRPRKLTSPARLLLLA